MELTYRKITKDDISALVKMVDCPLIQGLTLFQNANKDGRSPRKIFNDLVCENDEPVFHSYIVFNGSEPVAFLNRVMTSTKPGFLIVGGWVDKNHRGHGIFGKSLKLLIDDLRKEHPDRSISATAREDNTPSILTLEKIGFREIERQSEKIEFVYP